MSNPFIITGLIWLVGCVVSLIIYANKFGRLTVSDLIIAVVAGPIFVTTWVIHKLCNYVEDPESIVLWRKK